jgi:acetyl-CoA carboxylase biotin carboxyl carrier protein
MPRNPKQKIPKQPKPVPPAGGVDLAEVERLLSCMEKHHLEQFEYERDGVRILLKKASAPARERTRPAPVAEVSVMAEPALAPSPSSKSAASPVPATATAAEAAKAEDLHVIKSPIVGTFYAAAGPEAEPFVSLGDSVGKGEVLCIIEAMKLMNEIESDVAGEVAKIFAKNGSPVEYGEPLFGIRPGGKA